MEFQNNQNPEQFFVPFAPETSISEPRYPGTLEGFAQLSAGIRDLQTAAELERQLGQLFAFRFDNPNDLDPSHLPYVVATLFNTGASLESAGHSCAEMIAAHFKAALDREQQQGEPDPYMRFYMGRVYATLLASTRRDSNAAQKRAELESPNWHAGYTIDPKQRHQRRETQLKQIIERQAMHFRLIETFTQVGVIGDEFYTHMLMSPISNQHPQTLALLHARLISGDCSVNRMLQADTGQQVRALQNCMIGALQIAAGNSDRDMVRLQGLIDSFIDKNRPGRFPIGKFIELSNIVAKALSKEPDAPPDLTTGRSVDDYRNAGQALLLVLRRCRLENESPKTKVQLDAEEVMLIDIVDAVAEGISRDNIPTPMTIGDLILRFPNATAEEIASIINERNQAGNPALQGNRKIDRRHFRPGYGRLS
ncbi:MAG TPA: hypothetical protein VLG11_01790 [Candidatus Saccharimonadales bacterium]|nr:hypothetical protein [Candidatus Saccharimonadales bacterium]